MTLSPIAYGDNKKVTIKYRTHSQFDFAGDQVSGSAKGASVFYIFQRKRSTGHQVIIPPKSLNFHHGDHQELLVKTLK
jgi:hypothetical protein